MRQISITQRTKQAEAVVVTIAVFVDAAKGPLCAVMALCRLLVAVNMKLKITFLLAFIFLNAEARTSRVSSHIRSSGSVVNSHFRTSKDSSRYNNWSTKGNVNPFTGKKGYLK